MSAGAGASASEADQKANIEGASAIQSAESSLDLTGRRPRRCLQDNWKNNRGDGDCAVRCASGKQRDSLNAKDKSGS